MTYIYKDFARLCMMVGIDPIPSEQAYDDYLASGVVWSLWAVWYRRGCRQKLDSRQPRNPCYGAVWY